MAVAFVTGASSGIGLACADQLARAGYRVYGTSRQGIPPAEHVADAFATIPLVAMDVTSEESVRDALDLVWRREGRLDLVVNNAGMGFAGAAEDANPREAEYQIEVNFLGAVRVC